METKKAIDIDALRIIRTDANDFLGTHEIKDGVVKLTGVVLVGDAFTNYVKAHNLNELDVCEFTENTSCVIGQLSEDEKVKMKHLIDVMDRVKKNAIALVENAAFDKYLYQR